MDIRQFSRQFPLATLAQEIAKQRVETEPLTAVVHTLNKQTLALGFFQSHLAIFFAGDAHN
ncbi:hypothetical protein D3C75_924470 [compost metagenome]